MPTSEEIFDVVGNVKVFSTLDLRFRCHQLLVRKGGNHKTTFWAIDEFEKDRLYYWKYLPFELKNAPFEF